MKTTPILITAAVAALAGLTLVAQDNPQPRPPSEQPRRDGGDIMRPNAGIFGLLDANRDGALDAGELANAGEALRKLDRNGDGKITPDELRPQGRPEGLEGRPDMRPEGRDGERPKNGPRDGERQKTGPRDGERRPEAGPRDRDPQRQPPGERPQAHREQRDPQQQMAENFKRPQFGQPPVPGPQYQDRGPQPGPFMSPPHFPPPQRGGGQGFQPRVQERGEGGREFRRPPFPPQGGEGFPPYPSRSRARPVERGEG